MNVHRDFTCVITTAATQKAATYAAAILDIPSAVIDAHVMVHIYNMLYVKRPST